MKLLIVQFTLDSCHFLPRVQIFVSWAAFFHKCDRPGFTPCKTTGKIGAYTFAHFNFTFLGRWEEKRFWTECHQAFPEFNLLLGSLRIRFRFVTEVYRYLNMSLGSRWDDNIKIHFGVHDEGEDEEEEKRVGCDVNWTKAVDRSKEPLNQRRG
jgi:hypothetical protein